MNFLPDPRSSRALHRALVCFAVATWFVAILSGVGMAYASSYENRIYPGVFIGPLAVGGLTHEEAAILLSTTTNAILEDGLTISIEGRSARVSLLITSIDDPDTSSSLVSWDIDAAVREATQVGHQGSIFTNLLAPLIIRFSTPIVFLAPSVDEERLDEAIRKLFAPYDTPPVNAGFAIEQTIDGWNIEVTEDVPGTIMETGLLIAEIENQLRSTLAVLPLELEVYEQAAEVSAEEAKLLVEEVQQILEAAPYSLTYTTLTDTKSWEVTAEQLSAGLEVWAPPQTEEMMVGVSDAFTAEIFDPIATEVNQAAQDARFAVENGRVVEFQGNKNGVELDVVETVGALIAEFGKAEFPVELVVDETESSVTIGGINDLGITEILGIGTSDFSGSPANRQRNIGNGVRLLNGILIAPEQTFSLLEALRPFTMDNGYYPELVIKGDKIEPEVGGGLCQIGTTTFRAAMNAGLPIVERRNHSLVVRYYNDPQNGNPGTDATIYDPSPDFKFLNDTGHYILFAAEMDESSGTLIFTFWGTSDGRRGSYSAPEVSSWMAAGEKRMIETTDLSPGVEQCQHAFVGANASFTYTVVQADGTIDEEVFTSSYRPLPEICLVGVEGKETEGTNGTEETEDEVISVEE